jgi:alkanesulfonate monooxygenase SsuD/methylene tetrahydromethanopterin reductase-like flavin-dependent oxidoreductase (luciferase family)
MADGAGIEAMVPIARWRGYGGDGNPNGTSWETVTWAAGLLAATRRINVFATLHVPLNHPVVSAKQMVTADHIGGGRFGVNVVCGWLENEFRMFGVQQEEHDARYEQGAEWWEIVSRIWGGEPPFDYEGAYFRLEGVEASPGPFDNEPPLMMNAGTSPAGRDFAARFADLHFDAVRMPEESTERIAESKRNAAAYTRSLQVWTPIGVVCRPTQQAAIDFTPYLLDPADRAAVGQLIEMHRRDVQHADPENAFRHIGEGPVERQVLARGNFCAIGDPDRVAGEIGRLANAGFDGLAINFVNYLDELPFFLQEVLPRLESMGLRTA